MLGMNHWDEIIIATELNKSTVRTVLKLYFNINQLANQ